MKLLLGVIATGLVASAFGQSESGHPLVSSPGTKELPRLSPDQPLTIEAAVQLALTTNRGFATAVANLQRAAGRTGQARSFLNPTAGIGTELTLLDKPVVADFGAAPLTLTNQFSSRINAAVTLPIDITGAIRSSVGQAQFNEVAARIDVNRSRNQLVYDVRAAFYQALRAQAQLVVAQENLANATTRLEDARSSLRAGTGTQFDVLTAQRDQADAEQNVVGNRGSVTLALATLKSAIGIDISAPIVLTDERAVETPTEAAAPIAPVASADPQSRVHTVAAAVELGSEYETVVAEAIASRPEVLESDAALSAAQRGVAYARRSQLPTLALTAGYVLQPNAAGFTPDRQGTLGVAFNLPIFDGGLAKSRIQEARADVANAQTNRRAAVDQVTLDVQQAYVTLVQARERIRVATVGVTQAREAFRLARLRAQVGVSASPQVSPQLELSNAQVALTLAESNRVNALYDYNTARAQLDRAAGRFSYGPGGGYLTAPGPPITGQAVAKPKTQ